MHPVMRIVTEEVKMDLFHPQVSIINSQTCLDSYYLKKKKKKKRESEKEKRFYKMTQEYILVERKKTEAKKNGIMIEKE